MDEPRRSPLYLARSSYRRRRLIDAQRLLPIFLFLLYLLPLLWGDVGSEIPVGGGVRGYVHIFTVWLGAIVAAALIARALMRDETLDDATTADKRATDQGARNFGDGDP
jgi:hypothetical protein